MTARDLHEHFLRAAHDGGGRVPDEWTARFEMLPPWIQEAWAVVAGEIYEAAQAERAKAQIAIAGQGAAYAQGITEALGILQKLRDRA